MTNIIDSATDKRVKLYKAVCGIIPGGSFIAELCIDRIPNQRLDRVVDFIEKLESRLNKIESTSFVKDERYGYLAENSILESAKAYSSVRRSWLASICTPFVDPPTREEWDLRINAVSQLSSLSDSEVKYLLGYLDETRRFRLTHAQEDRHIFITMADIDNLSAQELFQRKLTNNENDNHRNSLMRLHFLEFKDDGSFKTYELTETGELFLYLLTGKMCSSRNS
ncbi:MAG: hypothetical protein WAV22_01115 [Porticoccaceae bacterium]